MPGEGFTESVVEEAALARLGERLGGPAWP